MLEILVIVTQDGRNNILSIAFAVLEGEMTSA